MPKRIPLPPPLDSRAFSARDGLASGLGRHRMLGPDLARPFRGVYLPQGQPVSLRALCEGLARRLGPDAFFCGVTAARLMSVPLPLKHEQSRTVHVGVRAPRDRPTGRGLVGHRFTIREDDIRIWDGLRITSPERTWCDLAEVLTVTELVAAGDYLIHWRLPITSVDRLAIAIDSRKGRRGVAKLREAHPSLHDRSESPQESVLRVILVGAKLGELAVNLPITTSGGFRYRADLAFPEHKVIIEYQSGYHESAAAFRADMTRVSRLEADGWKVILVNSDDLDIPVELVQRIRRVLSSRR